MTKGSVGTARGRAMLAVLLLGLTACGGGGLFTTTPAATALSAGTAKEFHFGSDYPAGLVIPDLAGLRSTAFVVSVDQPSGVLAIDLESDPLGLSTRFHPCRVPAGSGIPTGALVVVSATRLLFLTSSHLIDCDPSLGLVRNATPLLETITLPQPRALSRPYDLDGNGLADHSAQTFPLSFPGGLAVAGDRLFISFSNYLLPIGEPVAAAGILLTYRLMDAAPFVQREDPPFVTSAFNPTALRALPDGRVLVVNSGINTIVDGHTEPLTTAGLDLYNPATQTTRWIDCGAVALAFTPPALTRDGARAFVTSASYGEVYQIDLRIPEIIRGHDDPVTITSNQAGGDFLTQAVLDTAEEWLYVASFQQSAIFPARVRGLAVDPPTGGIVLGNTGAVSAENPSGSTTGIGALALRPGLPGIDFPGSGLVALTAFPGKLVVIDATAVASAETVTPPASPETPAAPAAAPGNDPATSDAGSAAPAAASPVAGSATPPVVACGATAFADAVASFLPGPGAGYGSASYPANVLGPPHGGTATVPYVSPTELLSLGCGGSIILVMQDCPIANGPGADFIVFENAFQYGKNSLFAEPAVVGVSYYGSTFAEFPCTPTAAANYTGCAGVHPTLSNPENGIDPTNPAVAGGDAFDLATLGVSQARYIRLRDVSCTTAPGPTAGFDLDALSVVWSLGDVSP